MNGRLTLAQSTPFMSQDTTSSVLWYAAHSGNTVPVRQGGSVVQAQFDDTLSMNLAGLASNSQHDIFLGVVGGAAVLVSSPMGGAATSSTSKITGGTTIGGMTAGGGLAAAFDGNTAQSYTACAASGTAASGYAEANTAGKDWGAAKTVSGFRAYGPIDDGFRGDGAAIGIKLQGWSGSAWVDLWTGTAPSGAGGVVNITSGITVAACTKHRVILSGNSTNWVRLAEVEFYETTSSGGTSRNLARVGGMLVNSAAIGAVNANEGTYLGSIHIDAEGGQCTAHFSYGPRRKFGVWNAYNQVPVILKAGIDFPPYPTSPVPGSTGYTPAAIYPAWGPAAQDTGNSLTVFTGLKQASIECRFTCAWRVTYLNGGGNAASQIFGAIGWDSTTQPSGTWMQGNGENFSSAGGALVIGSEGRAEYIAQPCDGAHVVTALESCQGNDWNGWCRENNMALTATYLG